MRSLDRPKFLNLFQLSYPPGALASVAHRATGVLLAIATPIGAYAFTRSVAGPEGFAEIARWSSSVPVRVALVVLVAAFAYHLVAGIRHLLMDFGIGASLAAGRRSAWAAIAAGILIFIVAAAAQLR
ncbi:MAG: succinate dehydrogenase, cytochrome b556 subunit [Burkholderiales bacterium]|nr:succinate dehydrogenase, cytochrome b556 subunit [Burkholderiales bacterium]